MKEYILYMELNEHRTNAIEQPSKEPFCGWFLIYFTVFTTSLIIAVPYAL